MLRKQQGVATLIRIEVGVHPVGRARIRVHHAAVLEGWITPHPVEKALANANLVATRVLRLLRIAAQAVEEAHLRIHHWVLAAWAQRADEVLKLHLVLKVVARDTTCVRVVILAKFQVASLCAHEAKGESKRRHTTV